MYTTTSKGKKQHFIKRKISEEHSLHYQSLPPAKRGTLTGEEIIHGFETEPRIKGMFISGLNSFDNKKSWQLAKAGKLYIPEARKAFFMQNMVDLGSSEFHFFHSRLRQLEEKFYTDPNYSFEHGIDETLEIWNDFGIEINGKYFTPFEVYASSWKFYEHFLPYNERWKKIKNYELPIPGWVIEQLEMNILVHSAKWLLGNAAERAVETILTKKAASVKSELKVEVLTEESEQNKNLDLLFGQEKISVKSGKSITGSTSKKYFKHCKHTTTMGPAKIDFSPTTSEKILMGKSKSALGIGGKVKVKNIVFDEFLINSVKHGTVSLNEFMQIAEGSR